MAHMGDTCRAARDAGTTFVQLRSKATVHADGACSAKGVSQN